MIQARPFRTALLKWYDKNKRPLPWRENIDPYRVLVSELMLQQTQVKTVLPYYAAFLKKFPTAKKLAAAEESRVLSAWSGLGYYRRARFLHAAAKTIAHSGFPRDAEGIRRLKGVGEYTAAALGSICFEEPVAVVDGNVIRVIARLSALKLEAKSAKGIAVIKTVAAGLLDPERPGDFNQAMMELGALVCSPRAPQCAACPVSRFCKAFNRGNPEDYPRFPPAASVTRIRKVAALIRKGSDVLCSPRSSGGRMIGLWHFPERELIAGQDAFFAAAGLAAAALKKAPLAQGPCGTVRHTVTRYRFEVEVFRFSSQSAPKAPWQWVDMKTLLKLPLASAEKKMMTWLA